MHYAILLLILLVYFGAIALLLRVLIRGKRSVEERPYTMAEALLVASGLIAAAILFQEMLRLSLSTYGQLRAMNNEIWLPFILRSCLFATVGLVATSIAHFGGKALVVPLLGNRSDRIEGENNNVEYATIRGALTIALAWMLTLILQDAMQELVPSMDMPFIR